MKDEERGEQRKRMDGRGWVGTTTTTTTTV